MFVICVTSTEASGDNEDEDYANWPDVEIYIPGAEGETDLALCRMLFTQESCTERGSTPFPGVSWDRLHYRWDQWWHYPCVFYSEQAVRSKTDDSFVYEDFYCQDYHYYWDQDYFWFTPKNRNNNKEYRQVVQGWNSEIAQFLVDYEGKTC